MPKGIQLWEAQSNIVRMFVTMNGEVQKYHGKFCLVPIWLLSVFRLFLSYGWTLLRPKWVNFLVETLYCATCTVGVSIFGALFSAVHATVAPLKAQLVTII